MSNFYGLIGEKLGHSISPEIHGLILNKLGDLAPYNLFEVRRENLYAALNGLKALGARGINVTIPYKIDVIKFVDNLSEEAEKIGAVNTISFNGDILTGYNTDYIGFGESLKKSGIEINKRNVVILGTGGVSRAVGQYLINNNVNEIIYVSREPGRKPGDSREFRIISYDDLYSIKTFDIIINCTPVGMYPNMECSPVEGKVLVNFSTAVDLIYNPMETRFLKESKKSGLKTLNGLYMLVAQAVAAQEIWHGMKISSEIVDEIYNKVESRIYGG